MTRIVSSAHRYKRPPQKKTPVALNVPSIVATKKNRPAEGAAAEAVSQSPHLHDGAAQPSTPRDAERDRAVTPPPANDDRPVVIISTTSRKRLNADDRHDHADHGDHHHQDIRAWWLERAKWGHGPAR